MKRPNTRNEWVTKIQITMFLYHSTKNKIDYFEQNGRNVNAPSSPKPARAAASLLFISQPASSKARVSMPPGPPAPARGAWVNAEGAGVKFSPSSS